MSDHIPELLKKILNETFYSVKSYVLREVLYSDEIVRRDCFSLDHRSRAAETLWGRRQPGGVGGGAFVLQDVTVTLSLSWNCPESIHQMTSLLSPSDPNVYYFFGDLFPLQIFGVKIYILANSCGD